MPGPVIFSIVAFGPVLFFLAPVFLMFVLLVFMAVVKGGFSAQEFNAGLVMLAIGCYVAGVFMRCYRICLAATSWKKRGWNICFAWAALLAPFCYILVVGIGPLPETAGVLADVLSPADSYGSSVALVAKMFLFAQVLAILWTFAAVRMLRYLSAKSKGALEI